MAGGVFDPAEFAAFKAGSSSPAPAAPTSGGFDPAEFAAFKSGRAAPRDQGQTPAAPNPFRQDAAPSFDERFGDGPMAGTLDTSEGLGQGLRRMADEALVGKPDGVNQAAAAVIRGSNALGLNIPRNAGAAIASAPFIGNGRTFSQNYDLARDQEEALARQFPKTALAGTVGGIVGGAVALPSIRAAEGANWAGRAVANFGTGALYGGASEFFDKKTGGALIEGGLLGGALSAGAGGLLEAGAKVYGALARRGVPFRDQTGQLTEPARDALRGAGIDPAEMTPALEQRIMSAFTVKGPSEGAAREALAVDQGITLSRAQATLDPRAVDLEQAALSGGRGARAQEIGQDFAQTQAGQIDAARGRLQTMAAQGSPLIDNPQMAFEAAADRARLAGDAASSRAAAAERAQQDALQAVQGPGAGDVLDGATLAVQGAREAAERSRGAYRGAYDEVAQIPGNFAPGALDDVGARVRRSLGPEIPVDDVNTPAAFRALADLDNLPRILGLREGETPTLQQTEQIRKRFSRYYPATAQNPTDRAALNAVRESFDQRIEDLLSIGKFGDQVRAPGAADEIGGSLGARTGDVPADAVVMPEAPLGSPDTLGRYIARNGGLALTDDARAMDLNRAYYPGAGTLARYNGVPLDQWRVKLVEAGYLTPDEAGGASQRDVSGLIMDALRAERTGAGRPRYRVEDEARVDASRAAERVADENADFSGMVDRQARRLEIDFEGYGLRAQDLDRAALRDAAEAVVRGETDDAIGAYDRAIMRREAAPRPAGGADDVPFPELGEGVGPATSASLPIGDTAPAEAMRKARGLFREHRQAFAPRGPGDVAGQRLQKIVERDASPNEAISMLFGTTTGRIASGQLQTLDRLRSAVGQDSDTWRAVQQAIVTRYVGGDGRGLGQRLDYLLRGEGRDLASRFLSPEQRQGLGRLRAAVAQTEQAQTAAPGWVQSLERHGFDPNAIAGSLFGSGVPGARVGAVNEARAAKAFLGETSLEWAGLRQAAVQRLTEPTMSAAKIVERVHAFTDGAGKGVATEMFSPQELGAFRQFASALNSTILPNGKAKPGNERAAGAVARALDVLTGAVAFKIGGPGAAIGAYGQKAGQRLITGGVNASRARRSFEGGAPRLRAPVPVPDAGRLTVGAGLYAGEGR
ncbi:hypothetical protein J2X36_004654 [Methylobacterium sp. BE186]|uniref:hypothetical protein n=1 Tax=Methylobacterium sp. BE186 TaxID=2817715 RepID=UPI0028639363|nr:hypothetical protein [Methylobacterium sp. BE186]MDR7039876.1 hypothetical protein [Methylobacterium sp. BE186]